MFSWAVSETSVSEISGAVSSGSDDAGLSGSNDVGCSASVPVSEVPLSAFVLFLDPGGRPLRFSIECKQYQQIGNITKQVQVTCCVGINCLHQYQDDYKIALNESITNIYVIRVLKLTYW